MDAAFELACWRMTQQGILDPTLIDLLDRWTREHSSLKRAWRALAEGIPDNVPLHATPRCEIIPVPSRNDLANDLSTWAGYLIRFQRSLVQQGQFHGKLASALGKALSEMVDNVVQHSRIGAEPARGLVGYHIKPNHVCYAVADTGDGILKSLRSNKKHAELKDSQAALRAAVENGATRREQHQSGDGFRQVFRALADIGALRFRSGDGRLTISSQGDETVGTTSLSPELVGLQVTIHVCKSSFSSPLPTDTTKAISFSRFV